MMLMIILTFLAEHASVHGVTNPTVLSLLASMPMILALGLVDNDMSLIGYGNGIMMTFQNIGSFLGTFLFPIFLSVTSGNYALSAIISFAFCVVGLLCAMKAKWKN